MSTRAQQSPSTKKNIDNARSDFEVRAGLRLREAREALGFTQGAVAVRTKLIDPQEKGISRTALIGYEQGASSPGMREIRLLCEVLHVAPNWLVFGTDGAAPAAQASLEFFSVVRHTEFKSAVRASLALASVKGHERDALLSLLLSLAGRQLGDVRLAGLLIIGDMMTEAVEKEVKKWLPDSDLTGSLEDLAGKLSEQVRTNRGVTLKLDDEGEPTTGNWLYPDPKS